MYKWKDELRIGYDEVDEQHRKLFAICERIEKNFEAGNSEAQRRTSMEGVKYLKEYTFVHFETEERLQRSLNYEDYEKHKMVHDSFKKQIYAYEKDLMEHSYDRQVVEQLLLIVRKWLYEHIMGMDQLIPHKYQK